MVCELFRPVSGRIVVFYDPKHIAAVFSRRRHSYLKVLALFGTANSVGCDLAEIGANRNI